jgi:hypothetical protein
MPLPTPPHLHFSHTDTKNLESPVCLMALAVTATARMTLALHVLALTRHGQSVLAPPDRIRVVGINSLNSFFNTLLIDQIPINTMSYTQPGYRSVAYFVVSHINPQVDHCGH